MGEQPHTEPAIVDPRATSSFETSGPPQWATVFEVLQRDVGGYAFVVLRNGTVEASGAWGYARMPQDTPGGTGVPFTVDTRMTLASVSKTVTATALFALVADGQIPSVNEPFWPYLAKVMWGVTPGPGVTRVTMGELLTMVSRLPENGTLYTFSETSTEFVAKYLENSAVIPTQGYVYSNTNFTILQEVIAAITGGSGVQGYVDWVETAILQPFNVDVGVFNDVPDDASTGTLTYNPKDPKGFGYWWPQMQCVGAGGWIGSAATVATYLAGVSSGVVIPKPLSHFMMQQLFGWYHAGTVDGVAFHHNGDVTHNGNGLSTGVVHFPDGSDAVLLTNAYRPGIIELMVRAYQTRGPVQTATT